MTCATRPRMLTFVPGDVSSMCHAGCAFTIAPGVSSFSPEDNRTFAGWMPTGRVCVPTPTQPAPPNPPPPNADTDGDGTPDAQDERPNDPSCSVGCGPHPGQQPPPPPAPTTDNQDDGRQVVDHLNPRLDAINNSIRAMQQAITSAQQTGTTQIVQAIQSSGGGGGGTGTSINLDPVVQAINAAASSDAANTQGVTDAIDALRDDLARNTAPADDGANPDPWTSANPIDPTQLDDGGFGWNRACPQFPTVGFMGRTIHVDPTGQMCTILQLLSHLILLAGFVHAGYIVASRGRA